MRILLFAALLVFIQIACTDLSNNYNSRELNKEFLINAGEIVVIQDVGLVIKFDSVGEDSRCPIDAICFWEGNAQINLELKNTKGENLAAQLNTSLQPKLVTFSNFTIHLSGLSPFPKSGETIDPNLYIAKLIVTVSE